MPCVFQGFTLPVRLFDAIFMTPVPVLSTARITVNTIWFEEDVRPAALLECSNFPVLENVLALVYVFAVDRFVAITLKVGCANAFLCLRVLLNNQFDQMKTQERLQIGRKQLVAE